MIFNTFVSINQKKMKNSIYLLLILFAAFALTSCEEKKSSLSFFNDFDNSKPWSLDTTIIRGNAHSGEYAIKVGVPREYSIGFKMKCKEISSNPLKKIKVSVWVNLSDILSEAVLVTGINSVSTPNIFYDSKPLKSIVKQNDKWTEVTAEYFINKGEINKPENTVLVYIWNKGLKPILMDDLKISFEEQ